jgi:serine/threonine protein kinase
MQSNASETPNITLESFCIANTYKIEKKIGSGAFGEIYEGSVINSSLKVAIKVEANSSPSPASTTAAPVPAIQRPEQLAHEAKIYRQLGGGCGIPSIYWHGSEGPLIFLVMELLGPSLEMLFNFCARKFSLKTVLMLADSMIQRVEYLHCKHYVHRDVKPDNFVMGLGADACKLFLIDFGLASRYRDPLSQLHIPMAMGKSLTGTARYAAINTHLGREQSRRDDLESLGYVLVYFLVGQLPWQGFKAATREEKYRMILECKNCTPLEKLCWGLPPEFAHYLAYVRALRFDERPDYGYMRRLFKNVMMKNQFVDDKVYDWMLVGAKGQKQEVKPSAFRRI